MIRQCRLGSAFLGAALTVFFFSGVPEVFAQAGFLFIEEPVNAANAALGSAGTALGNGGFSYYNPAGIAFSEASGVSFEYGQQAGDLRKPLAEFLWKGSNWFTGGTILAHSTDFSIATEQGVRTGVSGSYQGSQFTLGGGFIRDKFAFGIAVNGMQDRIHTSTAYGLSLSGGLAWRVIPGKLDIGGAAFHVGRNTGHLETDTVVHRSGIPRSGRLGAAWRDTVAANFPITVACDVVYREEWKKILVPLGIEVWPLEALALRFGKQIGHDTEIFSAGIGIRYGAVRYNASFVPSQLRDDVELKWLMSLSYALTRARTPSSPGSIQAVQPGKLTDSPPALRGDSDAPVVVPAEVPPGSVEDKGIRKSVEGSTAAEAVGETRAKPGTAVGSKDLQPQESIEQTQPASSSSEPQSGTPPPEVAPENDLIDIDNSAEPPATPADSITSAPSVQ